MGQVGRSSRCIRGAQALAVAVVLATGTGTLIGVPTAHADSCSDPASASTCLAATVDTAIQNATSSIDAAALTVTGCVSGASCRDEVEIAVANLSDAVNALAGCAATVSTSPCGVLYDAVTTDSAIIAASTEPVVIEVATQTLAVTADAAARISSMAMTTVETCIATIGANCSVSFTVPTLTGIVENDLVRMGERVVSECLADQAGCGVLQRGASSLATLAVSQLGSLLESTQSTAGPMVGWGILLPTPVGVDPGYETVVASLVSNENAIGTLEAQAVAGEFIDSPTPNPYDHEGSHPQLYCSHDMYTYADSWTTDHLRNNCRYSVVNWDFRLSSSSQASTQGAPVSESGARWWKNNKEMPKNAAHPAEPADYLFHGTFNPTANKDVVSYYDTIQWHTRDADYYGYVGSDFQVNNK